MRNAYDEAEREDRRRMLQVPAALNAQCQNKCTAVQAGVLSTRQPRKPWKTRQLSGVASVGSRTYVG